MLQVETWNVQNRNAIGGPVVGLLPAGRLTDAVHIVTPIQNNA